MTDNTTLNTGSGGDTIATDDIGGVKYPRSKIVIGADGTNDGDVSSANPLPVSLASVPSHNVTNAGTFAVQAAQSGTWAVTDGGGSLTVDGSVAITGSVTVASHDVTNAGTFAVQVSSGTVTTLTGSGVAHDAADSGNPHKIGAKATTALSALTLVSDADRTDLRAGIDGVAIVRDHCNLEDIVSGVAAITDGSSTSVIAAAGSGIKQYVTSVTIANSSATDVTVDIRDGAAGTVKWTFPVPQTGGVTHTFNPPLPFSANTAICADPSASASTVTVSILGFKSKV